MPDLGNTWGAVVPPELWWLADAQPSDIARRLPSVPLADRRQLPEVPGVYFVFAGSELVYVGATACTFRQRWAGHHRLPQLQPLADVRIAYLHIENDRLQCWAEDRTEIRLVPRFNARGLSAAKAAERAARAARLIEPPEIPCL